MKIGAVETARERNLQEKRNEWWIPLETGLVPNDSTVLVHEQPGICCSYVWMGA